MCNENYDKKYVDEKVKGMISDILDIRFYLKGDVEKKQLSDDVYESLTKLSVALKK